jgi:hypothetical protein
MHLSEIKEIAKSANHLTSLTSVPSELRDEAVAGWAGPAGLGWSVGGVFGAAVAANNCKWLVGYVARAG